MNLSASRPVRRPRPLGVGIVLLLAFAACGRQAAEPPPSGHALPPPSAVDVSVPEPTTTSTTVDVPTTVAEITTTTRAPVARSTARVVEPEPAPPATTTTTIAVERPTTTSTVVVAPLPPLPPASGGAVAVSHGGPVRDHVSLVDNLRGRGLSVMPTESVSQPFLRGDGTVLAVSGPGVTATRLQSFEYQSAQAASADAATFGPDGNPHGMSVGWLAPPHLYLRGQVLVIYLGSDPAMTRLLTELLGPQFAGR